MEALYILNNWIYIYFKTQAPGTVYHPKKIICIEKVIITLMITVYYRNPGCDTIFRAVELRTDVKKIIHLKVLGFNYLNV